MDGGYQLTEKQVDFFISQVRRWASFFGLIDWHIMVDADGDHEDYGASRGHSESRLAIISITNEWDIEPTNKRLSRIAFHEVCELLFTDISTLAMDRSTTDEAVTTARHRIIRVLEHVLWKPKYSKKATCTDS